MPRFDEPHLTRDGADVVAELKLAIEPQPALPALIEPSTVPPVTHPSDDPLVALAHPGIIVLGNYHRAGWDAACKDTWLRASALERLGRAVEALPDRFGLCVFDAWRPLPLQAELYESAYADPDLPPGFVSVPEADPTTPPPHLTGGTVDCSLTIDGIPLGLGAGFDDFTERARADVLEGDPGPNRELRRLLYWTMRQAGFILLDCEWWHFEYGTRRWAALTGNEPLFGPAQPPA